MFKIAKASLAEPFFPGSLEPNAFDHDILAQFCISESWVADLANGVIMLGEHGTALHGLASRECGLLNLMRCYEPHDRLRILELFEQAATTSSSFCYSATVALRAGHRQPVFCIGESVGLEQKFSGSMVGVFLFPRFKLDPAMQIVRQQ